MATMSITSNAQMVMKRLEKKFEMMSKKSGKITAQSAEFGKEFMQSIAPYDTGATYRAIKWTKGKAKDGKYATIVIGEGKHVPSRAGKINGLGGLTWYMNYGSKTDVWTSGDPKFIIKGVKEVRKRFGKDVRRMVVATVKG